MSSLTRYFRKLLREESAAKKKNKSQKLLIFARLLLLYHANGCVICLPFSIGTVRLYRKNGMAIEHLDVRFKNVLTTATVTAFYGGSMV